MSASPVTPSADPIHRKVRARMTGSDWLEPITMVHPVIPALIYVPVVFWAMGLAIQGIGVLVPVGMAAGALFWTFAEYVLHRWAFHPPRFGPISERIYFTFHGVHHEYPDDDMRLVMVPVVSIPLAFFFWWLFGQVVPAAWVPAVFAGFVVGYLGYDYTHWATHFLKTSKVKWLGPYLPILERQRRRHMRHHFASPKKGYGVTTELWDHVFGTADPQWKTAPRKGEA